jgi:hypothetical protein
MSDQILGMLDFADREEPAPTTDWRRMLTEWLDYQRHQFKRKQRDLSADGLVDWSVPPLELSVLGLVRHMTQMEHVYLSWGLGGGEQRLVYGDDDYGTCQVSVAGQVGRVSLRISGLLIQACAGSRGAVGGRVNRSGWAA